VAAAAVEEATLAPAEILGKVTKFVVVSVAVSVAAAAVEEAALVPVIIPVEAAVLGPVSTMATAAVEKPY
jgi:hypothetical protein